MNIISLLLSLVTISSFAFEISIGHTKKNSLVLMANSCEVLQEEYIKVCDWKKSINPNFSVPKEEKPYCKTLKNGKKRIIISKCLPSFVKKYKNKKQYSDGPNCWGTALNMKGISLVPRFVWQNEMIYWQESPICKRLETKEKLQAGDIINIYGAEYIFDRNEYTKGTSFFETLYPERFLGASISEGYSGYHNFLHSETYISKRISFGKESPNKLDRFTINKINETYGRSKNKNCQENSSLIPNIREYDNKPEDIDKSECRGYFSNAYRCSNFNDYFQKHIINSKQEQILKEIEHLKIIQKEMFKFQTLPKYSIPSSQVIALLMKVDNSSNEALIALREPLDKTTEMLYTLKYFTAHGIRKTLEYADLTEATELL
jgi:hypothetical protein